MGEILLPKRFCFSKSFHEQPNLYTLVLILKDESGKLLDCESCQVGLREISRSHKQILVNGQPVVIRGVNRHEHHPRTGKTNLEACMIKVNFQWHLLLIYRDCVLVKLLLACYVVFLTVSCIYLYL